MAIADFSAVDNAIRDVTSGVPGPQEGESVFDYRARLNSRLMEIVAAIGDRKRLADQFIRDHSDERLGPTDQFFNAVRQRFIPDEFEE